MVPPTSATGAAHPENAEGRSASRGGGMDRLLRLPLGAKIVVANAVIAPLAGVVALLLTRDLAGTPPGGPQALPLAFFVGAVVVATTLLNTVVVGIALSPLSHLAAAAERIRQGNLGARVHLSRLADPRTRAVVVLFNRMMDTLQAGRRRQKELARRILEAEERERERIAHELYAGPAQSLAGVMVRLRLAGRDRPAQETDGRLEEIRDEVAAALEEVRALARRLRPPELGELGVRAALEAHARTLLEGNPIPVTVKGDVPDPDLHPETATVLFRILQEAVTNALRHSGCSSVVVELTPRRGRVVAEVRDDGEGFDPVSRLRGPARGVGIPGMQERASYAGGTVTIASSVGGGTRVRVELPWEDGPWEGETVAPRAAGRVASPAHPVVV